LVRVRKTVVLSICLAALVLCVAPASAQKDPFDPILEEGTTATDTGGATVSSDTTTSTDTTGTTDTTVAPEPPSDEPMPSTGADPSNWIVVSGLLVVLGAGLVVMSWFLEPPAKGLAVRPNALDEI
jgi:LPXTG-motif cell wall-anchored protein